MAPRFDIREVQDRGRYWQVIYDVTSENGSTTEHGHSIPKDTLEWRAAEYDLDPADQLETLLDIVLAEPYIDETEQVGTVPGEELIDAPDIATARARHLSRCAKAKLKHRISTRAKTRAGEPLEVAASDNPLDVIRENVVIDPAVVAVKKAHVRRMREQHGRRSEETPGDRVVRIAEELGIDLSQVERVMGNEGPDVD
jgi:hypothetical protein